MGGIEQQECEQHARLIGDFGAGTVAVARQ